MTNRVFASDTHCHLGAQALSPRSVPLVAHTEMTRQPVRGAPGSPGCGRLVGLTSALSPLWEPTGFVWLFPQQVQPLRLAFHVAHRGTRRLLAACSLGPSPALLSHLRAPWLALFHFGLALRTPLLHPAPIRACVTGLRDSADKPARPDVPAAQWFQPHNVLSFTLP